MSAALSQTSLAGDDHCKHQDEEESKVLEEEVLSPQEQPTDGSGEDKRGAYAEIKRLAERGEQEGFHFFAKPCSSGQLPMFHAIGKKHEEENLEALQFVLAEWERLADKLIPKGLMSELMSQLLNRALYCSQFILRCRPVRRALKISAVAGCTSSSSH